MLDDLSAASRGAGEEGEQSSTAAGRLAHGKGLKGCRSTLVEPARLPLAQDGLAVQTKVREQGALL